jgi:hypothetical protein
MINIWTYLLALAIYALSPLLVLLPNASAISFAAPMVQGFVVFCELTYVFFSTFNLWLFGFYLGFWLIMTLLKIIMAVVNFIKDLLPLIIRLFA